MKKEKGNGISVDSDQVKILSKVSFDLGFLYNIALYFIKVMKSNLRKKMNKSY